MRTHPIALTLFLFLAACGQKEEPKNLSKTDPIHVKIAQARRAKVSTVLNYSGTIEPSQSVPLSFQTTGTIEKVLVETGDAVQKGQLLATLNETDARNLYQVALAKYDQAKDASDRLKKVHDEGSLPEIKWIEMETNLSQAKSSMVISKSNLEKCRLYSPVAGMVGRRNIEPGMSALSLTTVPIEIVDIRQLYIKISIPENEISRITKGMQARCSVSALNDLPVNGEITNISPVADLISRTYEVKILVKNPDKVLRPGMVCDVQLDQQGEREMVLIPYQGITVDKNRSPIVFVVDTLSKTVKKRVIQTGQYQNAEIEVRSGLSGGERIVTEGKEKLSDNSLIKY